LARRSGHYAPGIRWVETVVRVKLLGALARIDAAAKALSPEDQSLAAYRLRCIRANHSESIRTSRGRAAANGSTSSRRSDIVLCPPMPRLAFPHDHTPQRSQRDIDGSKIPISTYAFRRPG
jgi:hypothetical protein